MNGFSGEEYIFGGTSLKRKYGDVYQFTIHAGKNFIVLRGNEFTGDLSLKVK